MIGDAIRADLVSAAQELCASGLMPGAQGNLSVRDESSGYIAITPHDVPYRQMAPEDIVVVDISGTERLGKWEPSYELDTHLAIYQHRSDVQAVIHTEPPYATAFACLSREIPPVTTTGLKSAGGAVPLTEFSYRRDRSFAERMLETMGDRHAVLWANHGILVIGTSLHQAMERTYGVEFNAQVFHLGLQIGTPQTLSFVKDVGMVVA